MAGIADISIKETGLSDIKLFFESLLGQKRNFDKYLTAAFSTRGFRDIVEHFKDESGPNGPWPPRSKFTQELYDAIRSGKVSPPQGTGSGSYSSSNKLLQLTGRLRQSLSGRKGNIKTLDSSSIMVFSNVEYSGKHDEGDHFNSLPAREFMWLSDKAMGDMADILLSLIMGESEK